MSLWSPGREGLHPSDGRRRGGRLPRDPRPQEPLQQATEQGDPGGAAALRQPAVPRVSTGSSASPSFTSKKTFLAKSGERNTTNSAVDHLISHGAPEANVDYTMHEVIGNPERQHVSLLPRFLSKRHWNSSHMTLI